MSLPLPLKRPFLERLPRWLALQRCLLRGWCHRRAGRAPLRLSQQIGKLRWRVPVFALIFVLVHQTVEYLWFSTNPTFHFASALLVYGLIAPVIIWLGLGWTQHKVAIKETAEAELVQTHAELTRLNRRISFLLRVSQRLGGAADEEELTTLLLRLPGEIVPALVGSALIRFDDQRQPMPVEYQGTLDEAVMTEWQRYLNAQTEPLRLRCGVCQLRVASVGQPCPLFERLPLQNVGSIVCLPLERNQRPFAMLGLFLTVGHTLSEEERDLLEAVATESAIAFENMRLRTRELTAFYEVNETLQLRLDFDGLMARILAQTMEASQAEAGVLFLQNSEGALVACATSGDWRSADRLPLIESLVAGALRQGNGEPLLVTLGRQSSEPDTTVVLCAPMVADDRPLGAIVLCSRRRAAFLRQQVRLVSAIARQTALLVQNTRLYAQLEHQAILVERSRLAREMHDGLAQTLGYLKMRARQIARWVEAGQTERAGQALDELAQTADEAYLDLRVALDGLRQTLDSRSGTDLITQLRNCIADFERQTGLSVTLDLEPVPLLSPFRQVHLLRIVQESLSNIRKHAQACHVRLSLTMHDHSFALLIEDDGRGFELNQDWPDICHGLKLMRERAHLLGADLQVTSAPGQGTRVCIKVPLPTNC